MKTESNVELQKILYMPLPDGLADVWLRKNIEETEIETEDGKQKVWTADEVYFRTAKTEEEIEADFDAIFEAGGTGEVFGSESTNPEAEGSGDSGGISTLSERVEALEDLMVLVVEAEITAGLITEDELPEGSLKDTVKADTGGGLVKDFP